MCESWIADRAHAREISYEKQAESWCELDKRVSVIIPGYNTPENLWRRSIGSVKNSLGAGYEIICVDDGSEDGAGFLDRIPGICVIHQSNGGPSKARNAGLEVASGEWIAFLDSDDELLPGGVLDAIEFAQSNDLDVVVFGVTTVWPKDGLMKTDIPSEKVYGVMSPTDVCELSNGCLMNYVWNKVYRRDAIKKNTVRFPLDAVMGEDLIFNLEIIMQGTRWGCVSAVGYRYYRSRETLLSRYIPQYATGLRRYSSVWRKFKQAHVDGYDVLGGFGEYSEDKIAELEWKNMWKGKTPYTLKDRWIWLMGRNIKPRAWEFFKMMVFTLCRKALYVRSMRRYRIKRMCKNVVEWNGIDVK